MKVPCLLLAPSLILACVTPAAALGLADAKRTPGTSITIFGGSSARECYEAAADVADRERPSPRGMLRNAVAACDRALVGEALPHDEIVATHVNRGILRLNIGDADAAIADFDAALRLDPQEAEAVLNKAIALVSKERWDDAIALFGTALKLGTRRPALAYFGRGMAHEFSGDARSAYFDYRQATRSDPDWSRPKEELTRFTVVAR